jgi:hypothetical protein
MHQRFETHRQRARIGRIEHRAAIDDEPVHSELQLHQQLVAKSIDEISRLGGAADVADLGARACDVGQLDIDRLGVEARQLVFDRAQCRRHLAGQK